MTESKAKYALHITLPILFALISFFLLAGFLSSPKYLAGWNAQLDASRSTVLALTASSAASSAAITVLPGDVASPIAAQLAELSKAFLVVLCALYVEKFILAVAGTVAFKWLIPAACIVYITGFVAKKPNIQSIATRIAALAIAIALVVPASLVLSGLVEQSFDTSIHQVIESAENSSSQIQESIGANRDDEDAGNGLAMVIKNLQLAGDKIANGTSQMIEYFQRLLSRFVDAVAVMLVVSCIMPIVVMLIFFAVIKSLFQVDPYLSLSQVQAALKAGRNTDENN